MEKSLFIIQHIVGFDCEGETKTIIATRHCTKEAIEKEVDHLNDVIDCVELHHPESGSWNYFDFEKLSVSHDGEFDIFSLSSKKDSSLNMRGLRGYLHSNFDRVYNFYMKASHVNAHATLEVYLEQEFSRFLSGDVYLSDVLDIAENLRHEGKITTDISVVRASLSKKSMADKLSEKFAVKAK